MAFQARQRVARARGKSSTPSNLPSSRGARILLLPLLLVLLWQQAAAADSPAQALLRSYGLTDMQIDQVHQLYVGGAAGTGSRMLLGDSDEIHAEANGAHEEKSFASMKQKHHWFFLMGVLACTLSAATAAGLTVGLVSLDPLEMELKIRAGTSDEKKYAKKVLPIISRHHLLLCTLLLFNATANECLPLFLDELVPTWGAIVISVCLVLIFGEIIPSAIMTGPNQLQLAAAMSGPTWVLIAFFFPLGYPLGKLLDYLLGHETLKKYTRKELAELMKVQHNLHEDKELEPHDALESGNGPVPRLAPGSPSMLPQQEDAKLSEEEAMMVSSLLRNAHKSARRVMTTLDKLYALDRDTPLTSELRQEIATKGFSRVPVYSGGDKGNIRGFFHIKRLVQAAPDSSAVMSRQATSTTSVSGDSAGDNATDNVGALNKGASNSSLRQLKGPRRLKSGEQPPLPINTTDSDYDSLWDVPLFQPLVVGYHTELLQVLKRFKDGHAHMAIITMDAEATEAALASGKALEGSARAIGIITMEDIIETLLSTEIHDEEDHLRSGKNIYRRTFSVMPQDDDFNAIPDVPIGQPGRAESHMPGLRLPSTIRAVSFAPS